MGKRTWKFIPLLAALALVAGGLGMGYAAPIPGGTLDPLAVPKYGTPMLIPPVMPQAGTVKLKGGKNADYYEISVKQFTQQILPPTDINNNTLDPTTVWGYGAVATDSKKGTQFLNFHNAPSLTIEAKWQTPVRVKWINDLKDANGNYLPHLLTVDPTLHWANPPGGMMGRDTRPTFMATPGPYTGPVPVCTHLHGAVGVGDESDGYAEAWYLPAAANIPDGYATTGTWYDFFAGKAATKGFLAPGTTAWEPGTAVFQYPNDNRASTLWYHDHTLGMTRLNVYAGPAGFYLVRGGPAGDAAVLDSATQLPAVLPGPAPQANDKFPPNKTYYEIPIAIQDRSFNSDGSLFYPSDREFFGILEPDPANLPTSKYIPGSDISPNWNPEFFGNMMMVNGNTWPFQTVEQRRYRFRFLNGCQSRFLILDFTALINAGAQVWLIGNEGGFLAQPVDLSTLVGDNGPNRLPMGLAERADVIVDFTNVPVGSYILGNVGPDEPYGGGVPGPEDPANPGFPVAGADFISADPGTTGQIMQFNVVAAVAPDPTTPPANLVLPAIAPLPVETVTRQLALMEMMSMNYLDTPAEAVLGIVTGDPSMGPASLSERMWMEEVTENPMPGATEVWEFYNSTADAHPMHVHEVTFEVINRQPITVDDVAKTVQIAAASVPTPPEPWESGQKDTVTAFPGMVTRIKATFNVPGQYVWHCHIVEHEDNEMMRPYRIGPVQPGQPMPMAMAPMP